MATVKRGDKEKIDMDPPPTDTEVAPKDPPQGPASRRTAGPGPEQGTNQNQGQGGQNQGDDDGGGKKPAGDKPFINRVRDFFGGEYQFTISNKTDEVVHVIVSDSTFGAVKSTNLSAEVSPTIAGSDHTNRYVRGPTPSQMRPIGPHKNRMFSLDSSDLYLTYYTKEAGRIVFHEINVMVKWKNDYVILPEYLEVEVELAPLLDEEIMRMVLLPNHSDYEEISDASGAANNEITVEERKKHDYPLHWACGEGASIDVIKSLVEADEGKEMLSKVNEDDMYPLDCALKGGASLDVIKYLVEVADDGKALHMLGRVDRFGWYPGASIDVINYLQQFKHIEHIIEKMVGKQCKSLLGDHTQGKDLLGVLDEANAIAETIALKDLQPPFVVGMMGGWGSGKSFAFNLIQERLKEIQKYDLTNQVFKQNFPYVGHIYLVKFDAWTFAKGNLWSSVMYHILTGLNDQLDLEQTVTPEFLLKGVSVLELLEEFTTSGERKYLAEVVNDESVKKAICKWNPRGGNATKALIDATNSNYDKEVKDLAKKKQQLQEKKRDLAWRCVTAESNAKILPEIKKLLEDAYTQYAKENPEEPVPQTVDAAMNSITCFKKYWDLFQAGRLSPLWLTVFLTSLIVAVVLPLVLNKFGAIATAIGPVLSMGPVCSGIFTKYHDAREKLKSAQEEISKVASKMHLDKEDVQEAFEAANAAQLRRNTNDEEKQQDIIRDLNAEINSLEDRIWLRKGDSLKKIVGDRVDSNNYEDHLGVVHQAQADLKHLSDAILSNRESFPRGDPRIVLFIDDLDRCPPNKVVETLEAVQLLVKTKLFVVIMAIDAQYVTLCLEKEYKDILDPKRHPSGLDYVEKIVQLPYRVPPISAEYMELYLQEQMNAKKNESRELSEKEDESPAPEEVSNESKRDRPNDGNQSPRQPNEKTPSLLDNAIEKFTSDKETPMVAIPTAKLDFTWNELQLLKDACVFSGVSPRSGRRLVNVFKLMKIIWYRRDQTPNVETPKKKACVLILAMCASSSKRVRQGMCRILAKVEQTRSMPVECGNLKDFIEEDLKKGGKGQVNNNLLTMIDDEKWSRILEEVVWSDDEKWNLTKKDLRLVRSFSFVGEHNESMDDTLAWDDLYATMMTEEGRKSAPGYRYRKDGSSKRSSQQKSRFRLRENELESADGSVPARISFEVLGSDVEYESAASESKEEPSDDEESPAATAPAVAVHDPNRPALEEALHRHMSLTTSSSRTI